VRGQVRRRGSKWCVVVDVGRDANGTRQQRWHSGFKTRKAAEDELPKIVGAITGGTYVEPTKLTVSAYLARWLADYAKPKVGAKTYQRYEEMVRTHLAPALGGHPLAKLQPLHVQAYYSDALRAGRKDKRGGGLSPQTVLHHHRLLRKALQQAVRWQFVARNVADAVEPPSVVRKEMRALDEGQAMALLEAAKGGPYELPVTLAVTVGLRRGEIYGLQWGERGCSRYAVHSSGRRRAGCG